MAKKKNLKGRREVALKNLEKRSSKAEYIPKRFKDKTELTEKDKKEIFHDLHRQIDILKKRINRES